MVNNHQKIKQLLEKHISRDLSGKEVNELFDHLRNIHSPEDLNDYFQSRWEIDRTMFTQTDLTWDEVVMENQSLIEIHKTFKKRTRIRILWKWTVAASVLFIISLMIWNWNSEPEFMTYTTGYGETKNIGLEDGTTVILNANSEIIWQKDWKEEKTRYVWLRGEAYFEVAHIDQEAENKSQSVDSDRMPFQVKTSDMVIDVLGTTFNVSNRRGKTLVYLEEGSVKLGLFEDNYSKIDGITDSNQKQMENKQRPTKSVYMERGESVEYSAETKKLEMNNSRRIKALTEWKDGTLVYHDVRFGDMLNHMEDIYGKEFNVQDSELLSKLVTFGVPYENWKVVEKLMERTLGVEIKSGDDNKIIIHTRQ